MDRPRVFGIGFHKTGTVSLHAALKILGWRPLHDALWWFGMMECNRQAGAPLLTNLDKWDAFTDFVYPSVWPTLDLQYLGSKFILTSRSTESWQQSVAAWEPEDRIKALFTQTADDYESHNQEVRQYFAGRRDDFLELRICDGEGWEKLCPFLGVPIPDEPFPKLNVTGEADA